VSPRPDLDAMSDQDAPDACGYAAAQNAEIIQAGTVEIASSQFLGRDGKFVAAVETIAANVGPQACR